jgi:hypothetical protein
MIGVYRHCVKRLNLWRSLERRLTDAEMFSTSTLDARQTCIHRRRRPRNKRNSTMRKDRIALRKAAATNHIKEITRPTARSTVTNKPTAAGRRRAEAPSVSMTVDACALVPYRMTFDVDRAGHVIQSFLNPCTWKRKYSPNVEDSAAGRQMTNETWYATFMRRHGQEFCQITDEVWTPVVV